VRVWDLPVGLLCRQHLLGEHRELHAIWNILTLGKKGYRNHPEVKRWENNLTGLYERHAAQVAEMTRRGWKHQSALEFQNAMTTSATKRYVHMPVEQRNILRAKGCDCRI